MKVIKDGDGRKGWAKETTCSGSGNGGGGCGAVLLVEEDDLFKTQSHARDETTVYITFACCQCGVLTDLGSDYNGYGGVPSTIRDKLSTKNPRS